jgi:DNA ligase-associated metallophosphoesterase
VTERVEIRGEELILLPEGAILWQDRLLVADLHIGKVGHFRKNGIPVPNSVGKNNLWRLSNTLLDHKPSEVYFLGDLFHSRYNKQWDEFVDFIRAFEKIEFTLIRGNHDILNDELFEDAGIRLIDELEIGPFLLTHDRVESEFYNLHGHIHPGVRLRGEGRQSLRLPCFFFATEYGILPSFGDFTGTYRLEPKKGDKVFVLAENSVIEVS